jgi:hypothetical protein
MPFINEKISVEDKARVDWRLFKIWPNDQFYFDTPDMWTIDREKNAFFIRLSIGRPDGPPPVYALFWNGVFIRVVVMGSWETKAKGLGNWEIRAIDIPEELLRHRTEIIELLKGAIEAHGWNYSRELIDEINITFPWTTTDS